MGHLFLDFFLFISISLQFSPNWRVFLAIPQKFLANSLHVQIFISTFAIATISMRSTPHEQRARRYVQAQPTFSKRCGLIFLPITCRIGTRGASPLFMRSTPHGVEMQTEYGGSPSTCFLALCGGEHGCCSRRGSASRFFRTPTSTRAGAVLRQQGYNTYHYANICIYPAHRSSAPV